MSRRRPNPHLAKIHRSYTIEEVASLFSVHKNTIRGWVRSGLPVISDRRPHLILGRDIRDHLLAQRQSRAKRCQPDEMYCFKCREPRRPAEGMLDYIPKTAGRGLLMGLCPCCATSMFRSSTAAAAKSRLRDCTRQHRKAA